MKPINLCGPRKYVNQTFVFQTSGNPLKKGRDRIRIWIWNPKQFVFVVIWVGAFCVPLAPQFGYVEVSMFAANLCWLHSRLDLFLLSPLFCVYPPLFHPPLLSAFICLLVPQFVRHSLYVWPCLCVSLSVSLSDCLTPVYLSVPLSLAVTLLHRVTDDL